jgi:dihydrofolate reductase
MRLVVSEFVTLDGVMEDPGGSEKTSIGGWAFRFQRGEAGDKFKFDELMDADVQLLGRVTYAGFAAAWPAMGGNPFADRMTGMPKYVISKTLSDADATWNNTHILRGDVVEEVTRLKQQPGRDILVAGSRQLVQALVAHNLVDEYRLMVYPVVVGSGRRLFDEGLPQTALKIVDSQQTGEVLTLRLLPA